MATMDILLSQIDLVSAGEVSYPPGGRLGPRWQHDVELVLVHSGSAQVFVDERPSLDLGPDTVGLLLPGHHERFEFAPTTPTRHSWVQARLADPPAHVMGRLARCPRSMATSTRLGELVREAAEVVRTPLPAAEPLLAALVAAAVWCYVADAESRGPASTDVTERARRFLHLHLAEPALDLARVAEAAHVTPPHLVRRFRAELGVTPMAYLWQRRVAVGIDLLSNTGLPVGTVATRCGFRSVYHFSRRVKAQTGLPPTELRRRRWSQT